MTIYHIKKDGLPGVCSAKAGNCPLGDESDHYPTQLEALVSAEKKLLEETNALASQKKGVVVWHVSETGAAEECVYRDGYCDVKPYGKYNNTHTSSQDEAESIGRALREIQAKQDLSRPLGTPAEKKPAATSKASDPVTQAANDLRGDIYDSYRKKGWTEAEIQTYKDSCGHSMPPRFAPRPRSSC